MPAHTATTTNTASSTQRRMFRGRGGANDRRLPKHAARVRRRHRTHYAAQQAAAGENSDSEGRLYHLDSSHLHDADNGGWPSSSGEEASGETDSAVEEEDSESMAVETEEHARDATARVLLDGNNNTETAVAVAEGEDTTSTTAAAQLRQEMTHLRQRMSNVQSAFHSVTLADPATYQTNVLNAVLNCVNQWRSIVQHYAATCLSAADGRRGGQGTFELVQASLQTGPLTGGKPGYFKRCGRAVATAVHAYLLQICTSSADAVTELYWTEKQAAAWQTWTRKALQAAEVADDNNAAAPSASVLKNQGVAMARKQAKQAKRRAKAEQLGLA